MSNTSVVINNLRPKTEYVFTVSSAEKANEATGGNEEVSLGTTITEITSKLNKCLNKLISQVNKDMFSILSIILVVGTPGGLKVLDRTNASVVLTWLPVPSAVTYEVYTEPAGQVTGGGNITRPP